MENKDLPETGFKDDESKPRWDLLPFPQVQQLVTVLTTGAKKYSDENWKLVKDAGSRYFAAAMRHLTAWQAGERKDPESGQSPLAHACCNMLFLMWFDDLEANEAKKKADMKMRCECGERMEKTFEFDHANVRGASWECLKCHRTVQVIY